MIVAKLADRAAELEQRRRDALLTADAATLRELVLADAVYVHANGTPITGEQWVDDLAQGAFRYDAIEVTDQTVTVRGDAVAITFAQESTIRFGGEAHHSSSRSTAVYAGAGEDMRLIAYQTTLIQAL